MNLNDLTYDLSTIWGTLTQQSGRSFSVNDLAKRYPVYYELFRNLVADNKIPTKTDWNGNQVATAGDWLGAIQQYIPNDPITLYRTYKNDKWFNPLENTPEWKKNIYSEVWASLPEYVNDPTKTPPKEAFTKFAESKLEEVTKLAENQIKATSSQIRPDQFTYNGNVYSINNLQTANSYAFENRRVGSPYATLNVVDANGKADRLVFIPESYLLSGEKVGNTTFLNEQFLNQDFLNSLGKVNLKSVGAPWNNVTNTFGTNGYVISEADLKQKFPKIFQSIDSGDQSKVESDAQLVSFAGNLAYKFNAKMNFQGVNYVSTGVGPAIAFPVERNNVGVDAYLTSNNYGDEYSYEKLGSGYATRRSNIIFDTISALPEPQKPNWGAFIAAGAGIFLAGAGLATALSGATTTSLATTVGTAVGLTGTAASVGGAAIIGATLSELAGGDPLTGAVIGGLGELTAVGNYAEAVGRSLGATTATSAAVIGNIALSSAMSGLTAAALGQDVGKSMLAGGIVGGVAAGAEEVASAIVGGKENLANIASSLGFYGEKGIQQTAQILSGAIAQGVVAEINQTQTFGEAVLNGLVAGGVSTKVANEVVEGMRANAPTTRAIFNATRQITSVATTAALNNQDVSLALENAAPGIIITSFRELTTPDQQVAEQVQKEQEGDFVETTGEESIAPVAPPSDLVAEGGMSVEDQELLNQIQEVAQRPDITGQEGSTELAGPATPSFIDLIDRQNERLVGGPQVSTEVDSGVTITSLRQQVVGTLPDGREYLYTIVIDPDTGERFYEWSTQGAPSAEGVAAEQVLNASRTKPDFQKLFAEPGVPGGAGGDIQTDIENIISGEGLEEVTPTTPTQVETPIVVTEQEQAPTIPAQTVTGGETVQEVTPTQPPAGPVTDQDIIEVIQGETLPETGGEVSTVPVGEATTPIQVEAPTIVAEEGQATVPPSTVAPAEITDQISVVGGEAPADTIAPTDVTAEASVPAGEITDEDIIEIITSEGTPTVTPGEETPTIVGGEATTGGGEEAIVLPPETVEGGTPAEQTITGGEGGGETVLGGEAGTGGDTVIGGEGDIGEVTLPGGGGEATLPGGGEGEISDEDILNIIGGGGEATLPGGEGEATLPGGGEELPAVTTGGGEGEEDTIFLGGGEGEGAPPTEPEDEDQAILDLIKELEGEEGMEEIPLEEEVTAGETGPRPVVTVIPRPRATQRPGEAAPYRVTGQDESGILGRKQPLFGGDEDLQRAEWNRRSLRLRRLLGL
jgi:hypothetical protein